MKSAFALVASAAIMAITACAGFSGAGGDNGTARPPLSHAVLPVEQLHNMQSTGFDALNSMPTYRVRVHQVPMPPFVLVLDGLRIYDLEVLKAIQARDLFEIRVVGETQSTSAGAVEVVVTTVGGRKRP